MTTAYIETSIPSFYFTGRVDAFSIARQRWTPQWWAKFSDDFQLYSSLAVNVELERGALRDLSSQRISFIDKLPMLEITRFVSKPLDAVLARQATEQKDERETSAQPGIKSTSIPRSPLS